METKLAIDSTFFLNKEKRLPCLKFLIVAILTLNIGCHPLYGFVEAEFQLSTESRLPKWIKVPSDYTREDLTVSLIFYTFKKVKITVSGPAPEHKVLMVKIGTNRWHPITERKFKEQRSGAVYPNYSIITVDGTEEIFEQKGLEPMLYLVDAVH